ncbi:glucosaminidase domain-containing protein [Campylobacter sp. MIT 21-1685]|uniref:glucosaminidase domain-containing protein n=1 Tax=unclassified Campylobacter TaxID=2593542 RepID=UPI00224A4FF8|nr:MULTISPECIES: glucosaminidase domain-containing protein [unclassified Campylobacter]MCX2683769.1 glucosaminidase domain-containing protein [Campylobacter sp. MIT 21-1684]MCX2752056.1 glucosaminidase domain-containing protein [Campylobacter sp. MIT 21-1682]MCX2808246.1 glucosaminidase domain-containing protein [Campylobacter sp. MIT 21-1685]
MKHIIIFLSCCIFSFGIDAEGFGKNYYELKPEEKRMVFFAKMNEMFDISFQGIEQERSFALAFLNESAKNAFRISNQKALERLIELKNKYRIENLFDISEYKKRIQKIPKSMGIAQALVESATGTSRFAREANNLFGEWTWGDKGLIPKKRQSNKKHKIKIFDNLQESVDSYVLNLNRHYSYQNFRELRADFLKKGKNISGLEAIKVLNSYSELKGDYIKLISNIIKQYKLEKYDSMDNFSL